MSRTAFNLTFLNPVTHKALSESVQAWFCEVRGMPEWVRTKSPVWRVLRDNLRPLGHWRARPRGNPKRGYLVSRERMNP